MVAGLINDHLTIKTFWDSGATKIVDSYDAAIGLNVLNYLQLSGFDVTFTTTAEQRAA
jgi:hypothetical protein